MSGRAKLRSEPFPTRICALWPSTAGRESPRRTPTSSRDAIEAFYLGNFAGPEFTGQNHLAPYISTALGMTGIPSTRFEAACASSGAAFFQAFMGVASGIYDVVMVVGVEKMTCQPTRARHRNSGRGGGLRDRSQGRVDVSFVVRHDRPPPHARFRHHARATLRRRREEPRERRAESRCADAQGDHARTGDERAADCRAAESLRLLADQRRRGGGRSLRGRSRARIHRSSR